MISSLGLEKSGIWHQRRGESNVQLFESSKGHMRAIRPIGLCLSLSVSWELAGRISEVKSLVGTDFADTAFNL